MLDVKKILNVMYEMNKKNYEGFNLNIQLSKALEKNGKIIFTFKKNAEYFDVIFDIYEFDCAPPSALADGIINNLSKNVKTLNSIFYNIYKNLLLLNISEENAKKLTIAESEDIIYFGYLNTSQSFYMHQISKNEYFKMNEKEIANILKNEIFLKAGH